MLDTTTVYVIYGIVKFVYDLDALRLIFEQWN